MKKEAFDEKDKFSYDNGFNIAIALTSIGNKREEELDPTIGSLHFYATEWGLDEQGDSWLEENWFES